MTLEQHGMQGPRGRHAVGEPLTGSAGTVLIAFTAIAVMAAASIIAVDNSDNTGHSGSNGHRCLLDCNASHPALPGQLCSKARIDAQHFTEPPPRFSEATLVKKLEELGIGRPSTYASTLAVLRDREYVRMDKGRFVPEDKGRLVTAFLESFFLRYVEYDFTAALEEDLDRISNSEIGWKEVLRKFWKEFSAAIGETTDQMRKARRLIPTETDNFVIDKSDKFAEMFIGFLAGISGAAGAIGMITLIGAAIGLMNIMLVAVSERTREVGLIKALGGKKKDVRRQFLFESICISILGAVIGIFLGILVGNLFSYILNTGFVVPWLWVFIGIAICTLVGLAAGIYPAMKAASLNPINALRYE